MRVVSWVAVGLVVLMTIVLPSVLAPGRVVSEAADPRPPDGSATPQDRIDIVHDVVTIDVTRPVVRPLEPRKTRAVPGSVRVVLRAGDPAGTSSRPAGNALLRAARALAGDGRYRPEPFPTPKP